MNHRFQAIGWNDSLNVSAVVSDAQARGCQYLLFGSTASDALDEAPNPASNAADLVVLRTSEQAALWKPLDESLPVGTYFLAVSPTAHAGVAARVQMLAQHVERLGAFHSWNDLLTELSTSVRADFIDDVSAEGTIIPCPALTTPERPRYSEFVKQHIGQLLATGTPLSATAKSAFQAGLYLLNGLFDESHSCSQSIEGMGMHRDGDYWHAILHRREPDPGNAKYWFRHVGRHPIFPSLGKIAEARCQSADRSTADALQRWRTRLMAGGWDPFAFVDLCDAAQRDQSLRRWCERLQYEEMLLLLRSTVSAG